MNILVYEVHSVFLQVKCKKLIYSVDQFSVLIFLDNKMEFTINTTLHQLQTKHNNKSWAVCFRIYLYSVGKLTALSTLTNSVIKPL